MKEFCRKFLLCRDRRFCFRQTVSFSQLNLLNNVSYSFIFAAFIISILIRKYEM